MHSYSSVYRNSFKINFNIYRIFEFVFLTIKINMYLSKYVSYYVKLKQQRVRKESDFT